MASPSSGELYVDQATIDLLQGDGTVYAVTHIALNNDMLPNGTLGDVVEVSWRLIGKPGSFTTVVPYNDLWDAFASDQIFADQELVQALYRIAV